jgi:hypothetical protein
MTNDAPPTSEETLTEKLAFADVLAWAAPRPAWQRDALRRLVQNVTLDSADIDELAALCLDATLPHDPISDAHVASQGAVGEPITILRIENTTGVNALAPDQKLEFAKDGLSIVYGDNGSGKSGYVRVLKHACRTRDRSSKILRDVEDAAATPQSANIHRKAVAARLVEEAEHRQVIVFTHDLTFLFELRREAEAKTRPVQYQTVCRKQSRPGFVEGELPMKAKSAQQLAHSLRSELKEAKHKFDTWPDKRRTIFCKESLSSCANLGIRELLTSFFRSLVGSTMRSRVTVFLNWRSSAKMT